MTSIDDDDLPVLTHILRTADGHSPSSYGRPRGDVAHDEFHFGVPAFDEARTASPIVIGHEIPAAARPADVSTPAMRTTDQSAEAAIEPPIVADPRQHATGDAFGLVQYVDHAHAASVARLDEPALATSTGAAIMADVDVPFDFSTASVAARVRQAVLDGLAARIDTELDARIAQVMHVDVETALAQLQRSLRVHLGEALRDVVARAVDEEIARATTPHDRH